METTPQATSLPETGVGGEYRSCGFCSTPFRFSTPRHTYCSPGCAERKRAEVRAAANRARRCVDCAGPLSADGTHHPNRRRCEACARTRNAQRTVAVQGPRRKAKRAARTHKCAHCGRPFKPWYRKKSCSEECARALKAARQRAFYRRKYEELGRAPDSCQWNVRERQRRLSAATVENVRAAVVFERGGWTCGLCGSSVDPSLRYPDPMSKSVDHVIPIALGGKHCYANVQTAHLVCNLRKNRWVRSDESPSTAAT